MDLHEKAPDNDSDLSFEALTFGDNSNGDLQSDKAVRQPPKKKDKIRKKNGRKDSPPLEAEKSSSVYITTLDDKIDVQLLLRKMEQYGPVRGYYFKEKANFGIVQFVDHAVADIVIENFDPTGLGFEVSVERTPRAKDHLASPHSFGSMPPNTPLTSTVPSTPPPEKPDTILVLKNLPFTLKQDQLHEILLSLSTTIPQSISLHYDNVGVFRGMAFIKYRQIEDAIQVYELLNGMDVGGRKVRVEYKRKPANNNVPISKSQSLSNVDIPVEWMEDEELRWLWEQLKDFKEDVNQNEWFYPTSLTNNQKRNIYNMSEKLKLVQGSSGDTEVRVQFLRKGQHHIVSPHAEHHVGSVDKGRGIEIKGRRPRQNSDTNRAGVSSSPSGNNEPKVRSMSSSIGRNEGKQTVASSAPADMHLDWRSNQSSLSSSYNNNHPGSQAGTPQQASVLVSPLRQPKGPDGSKGFGLARKLTLNTTCAFLSSNGSAEVSVA